MKWVTRARPKADRLACPWLIRRFVDPDAEFLYVAADDVTAVAAREGGIPFDVANVELGHHGPSAASTRSCGSTASPTPRSSASLQSSAAPTRRPRT